MKLLVAGGSGFLGRNLLLRVPRGWEVAATYRGSTGFPAWLRAMGLDHVTPVSVDLADGTAVERTLGSTRPDACAFLAADTAIRTLMDAPSKDVRENILATANVLEKVRGGRLVYMSSGAVYMGHSGPVSPRSSLAPTIPYAIAKQAAEHYVRHSTSAGRWSSHIILRFFGAYGPLEPARKITTQLIRCVEEGKEEFSLFGDGENLIDVMHVDDAVDGLLATLRGGPDDLTLDFCSGTPCSLNDYVHRVGTVFDHRFRIRHEGASPEYIRFSASPEETASRFGVRPSVPLSEGLKRFRAWLRSEASADGA